MVWEYRPQECNSNAGLESDMIPPIQSLITLMDKIGIMPGKYKLPSRTNYQLRNRAITNVTAPRIIQVEDGSYIG